MRTDEKTESGQYLTFRLEEEIYALDIAQVREVLDFTEVTKVPRMPDFMRGVINLRGSVVSVIDLRLKFGLPATEKTVETCIVIMEITLGRETTLLGALADSVLEVISIDAEEIAPPPRIGTRLDTGFIRGMGRTDEAFVIILDVDRVFSAEELTAVRGGIGADGRETAGAEAPAQ